MEGESPKVASRMAASANARAALADSSSLPPFVITTMKILDHWSLSVMHNVALTLLTLDSILAAFRARGDARAMSFVLCSYGVLLLLYRCIRGFDSVPRRRKRELSVVVWVLGMFLTVMLSYRMSFNMPFGFKVLTCIMTAFIIVAGLYSVIVLGRPWINTAHKHHSFAISLFFPPPLAINDCRAMIDSLPLFFFGGYRSRCLPRGRKG